MNYDVVIVGSGIVGATAALALAQTTTLKIAIVEAKAPSFHFSKEQVGHRVSAISLASKYIFQNLGVWESIQAQRVSPYHSMRVWDAGGTGEIYFDCKEIQEEVLGYIIEDNVIRDNLLKNFSLYPAIDFLCPVHLTSLHEVTDGMELLIDNHEKLKAKLVIAADGAHSWVREQAKIELKKSDYNQTAIVSAVHTEWPHQATAWQRFLSTGPLAFLPLQNSHTSSIVWSTTHEHAAQLLALNEAEFCEALGKAFAHRLGKIISAGQRYHFVLRKQHVKHYIQSRLALVGDAAHTIHPMLGQGVNLGLLDAACLVEVIRTACQKNREFFSLSALRRYERWRKKDTLVMLAFIDAMNYLFLNEKKWAACVRNIGLTLTNRLGFVKNFLAEYAAGNKEDLPEFAKEG